MNYLKNNLNNSKVLPYDVMKLISEYTEPLFLKQIENKDYDLGEIMYKRMKKKIINEPFMYDIDMIEILDKSYIVTIYKDFFLKEKQKICGLYCHHQIKYNKYKMLSDLEYAKIYKAKNMNYEKYKMKNVYKKWLML